MVCTYRYRPLSCRLLGNGAAIVLVGTRFMLHPVTDSGISCPDDLLRTTRQTMAFESPHVQDVQSVRNWQQGTACMSREEMEYLNHDDDLLTLAQPSDGLTLWLQRFVSVNILHLLRVSAVDTGELFQCARSNLVTRLPSHGTVKIQSRQVTGRPGAHLLQPHHNPRRSHLLDRFHRHHGCRTRGRLQLCQRATRSACHHDYRHNRLCHSAVPPHGSQDC